MTIQQLKELARHAAHGTAPANFECENVNAELADGLKELCGSVNDFMRNKYDIYEIIIKNADEIVPNKVLDAVGAFAEVQRVPQGQKAIFKRGIMGKNRARKFLTQVGLSGVYETFRLDTDTFTLEGSWTTIMTPRYIAPLTSWISTPSPSGSAGFAIAAAALAVSSSAIFTRFVSVIVSNSWVLFLLKMASISSSESTFWAMTPPTDDSITEVTN